MSKALELTVYLKDPTYEPSDSFTVYLMGDGTKECAGTACALPSRKRLTDAELAAEYWRAKYTGVAAEKYGPVSDENREKIKTVERFYQLPHYDEDAR